MAIILAELFSRIDKKNTYLLRTHWNIEYYLVVINNCINISNQEVDIWI